MSTTQSYAIGQRWLSNTESELGLGLVTSVDFRSLEVLYPATNETRRYTKSNAPLTRLIMAVGDTVKSVDGWEFVVSHVEEQNEVVFYQGIREDNKADVTLPETQLDHSLQLDKPEQRLFNLQLDSPKWFDLRLAARLHQHSHVKSAVCGLAGARISLIPHQVYIASEVASRHAPRVLLADEVGLGKTIEAALIIHQQLLTGRAQRVLIMVPESLCHQWLVEMLRRVNLAFSLFDESRWQAILEESEDEEDDNHIAQHNPFEAEQLVLCSTQFISGSEKRLNACAAAGWDLIVVDEAHHLTYSPEAPSAEYLAVEQLAENTQGLVLLTATPDQLGHESHFARLRLLDPDRFYDYDAFLREEKQYSALASAIDPLLHDNALTADEHQKLLELAPEVLAHHDELNTEAQKNALLTQLIDCHGTGRLLFRNRRTSIEGFPQRFLHTYPLAVDSNDYIAKLDWLIEHIEQIKPEKILLICQQATTAINLSESLRTKTGVRSTVFHEGMSIVERDKSAHFFADREQGAQIMLCSEIGSEGRNFQFAHHLVLFDLPNSPDLLEQRIGRLDRIGQSKDVQLHVPFIPNTPQAVLLRWYHDGLDAFEHTCPTGRAVYEKMHVMLEAALAEPTNSELTNQLVDDTFALNQQLKQQLEQGRDRLLELGAAGMNTVEPLLDDIVELDTSPNLMRFMGRLFDALGVQQEEKDSDTFVLRPTETMVNHLPGLDPEGMTVTYRRNTATTLDHVHFLTWDHPLVQTAIDAVLLDVHGKSCMAFIADRNLPTGAYWLEIVFVLQASAPTGLQVNRFLPPTPIRIVLDANSQQCDLAFDANRKVPHKMAKQLVGALQVQIEHHLSVAKQIAHAKANQIQHDALENMHGDLGDEVQRLRDLKQLNPSVRESEIKHFVDQRAALDDVLKQAALQLDAIRLVINNP